MVVADRIGGERAQPCRQPVEQRVVDAQPAGRAQQRVGRGGVQPIERIARCDRDEVERLGEQRGDRLRQGDQRQQTHQCS